jgi:hypothetical protein
MRKYKKTSKLINNTGYTPGYASESNPINYIPSEDITMRNTPYPVDAMPLDEYGQPIGDTVTMYPGEEYKFGGASYVAETPSYKDGGKSDWISEKIGILIKEGRPQKQAIAIAYSMWNQKHEMGGTQLPKYQFAGTAELDEYGQPLPKPSPAPTFDYTSSKTALGVPPQIPNILKPVDLNAPTAASNKAYADQQAKAPQTISISDSELANPTMNGNIPSKEQKDRMAFNKQVNTAANNYDDNGNAIDTSLAAEARKKAEASGMGITQFINPYGDVGLDDALAFTGKSAANGNVGATVGGAALSLLKGTKSFLQGMGAQKRQNQVMKDYAEEQRKNMTGEDRPTSMAFGGYYQDGGEEDMGYENELINKYPNSARVEAEIAARNPVFGPKEDSKVATDWYEEGMDKDTYYGFKDQLEAEGYKSVPKTESAAKPSYDEGSARDTWVAKTGLPWSEAKRLGYTDGSAKDNTKLLSELKNEKFKKENLRKTPVATTPKPVQRKATPKAKAKVAPVEKTMTLEDFWKSKGYDMSKRPKGPEFKQDTRGSYQRELDAKRSQAEYDDQLGLELPLYYLANPSKAFGDFKAWLNPNTPESETSEGYRKQVMANRYNPTLSTSEKLKNKTKMGLKLVPKAALNTAAVLSASPYTTFEAMPIGIGEAAAPRAAGFITQGTQRLGQAAPKMLGYQDGGMQPEMGQEQMMMGNPQEEQAGGDQMQAIVQQVAGMLQQGADPQEILQQLVQAGLPEEQAMQVIQMVMEQMQGGQPQATPQLGRGGQMMRRADGSYSKRGLWDNIRDNAGSGKAPTKEMLAQEAKIKANKKEMGGFMYADGGINNPGFKSLPKYVQDKIMSSMYQEGGEAMDEQMEGENEGAEGETPNMEQIESQVEQALKQGADPQQILEQLVQMGMPEQQAIQMIQELLQEIQGGETEMEGPEQGQPMMRNGGDYLSMMKGKTIKNYTYNKKTGNYDVEFE